MKKVNSEVELDLVFKHNNSFFLRKIFADNEDKYILNNYFWETVFVNWIKIVKNNNNFLLKELLVNKKKFSLSFEIVDNYEIANLNQKWLDKKGPTDVLSFPIIIGQYIKNEIGYIELGDLFISLEMAYKQALIYKHSLLKEMLFLASHGFLHLMGWEHNDQEELDQMLSFQEYLISQVDFS